MCLGVHNNESKTVKPNVASIAEKPTLETQAPLEGPGKPQSTIASTGTNKKKAA